MFKTSKQPTSLASFRKRINRVVLWVGAPLALGGAIFSVVATGQTQTTPPNIPPIDISHLPLYAVTPGDKPALALALSVEFPTVGAQYVGKQAAAVEDDTYSPKTEYIGYYNAEMCYTYQDAPPENPGTGESKSDYKRFVIDGAASGRRCSNAFSGNFLNWASNSAIDMLRLALSGGDRLIDKPELTILQRAVLPNGDPSCFWNNSNFPAKKLQKGSDNNYAGAVPRAMINAANGKTIWVANILNRIYFRADDKPTGSCTDASGYRLTAASALPHAMGEITDSTANLPSDAKFCSGERSNCSPGAGLHEVWFGENERATKWRVAPVRGAFRCEHNILGDPAPYKGKSCYVRPYSGPWSPPAVSLAANELNSDGFFYSRVQVCNKDSAGELRDKRDYNFCTRYPSGHFKPTGVIQKYSNQLRLAAFGYALDQIRSDRENGRYGGVLRAPMKYVGYNTYDENGMENTPAGGNPSAEWDVQTGVFTPNPLDDKTFGTSGVINYLNKFGRTYTTKPGVYKQYDPASELYYETLRYLQGLPPSEIAVERLDKTKPSEMRFYDGFPIYTDWKGLDPYGGNRSEEGDYSCLKSNIALIGDVNTHDSKTYTKSRMPGPNPAENIPNIDYWLKVVQAFERKEKMDYVDGSGKSRSTLNPNPASYTDEPVPTDRYRSSELIGLAYWAHTHDIRGKTWTGQPAKQRPGLRVKSFFFDVNEYGNESRETKRRTNNQYYTAAKYGGFFTHEGQGSDVYNTQGNPFYDQNKMPNNDVWQDQSKKTNPDGSHTYVRELEPHNYFLQSNARGVLEAFEKIFSDAVTAERSIAGSSTSGGNLTSAGLYSYQASFDTKNWSGDLQAYRITPTSLNPSVAAWSAKDRLNARTATPAGVASRKIVVGRRGANPGVAANWFTHAGIDGELELITDLDRPSPTSAPDGKWKDRLDYLRGDKSKENAPFRVREHALADIVNSGAQYIGAPGNAGNMAEGRAAFAAKHKDRKSAVYVGANDGMLHAFDAGNGEELFAYIPSWMGPKLSALTDINYKNEHQAYVDATPVIGDAKTGSGADAEAWKTVLVGGTGGGGRGVFALDVTDPTNFEPSKVMWEFTHLNDKDMGFVIGKPRIVRMLTSGALGTDGATYRWFAMVPSGVNNYVKTDIYATAEDYANNRVTGSVFSDTGKPAIFLLALDKPAGEAWELNKNYYKISLPFDATLATTKATGIINLEAMTDRQGTGTVEYVFAGDLHGNFWALDFTKYGANGWTAAKLSKFTTGSAAYPMYIAKDASGNIQPITAAPTILRVSGEGEHVVGFGTGKYIEPSDATSTQQNTYYALYDNDKGGGQTGVVGIDGRNYLMKVTSDTEGNLKPENAFEWGRATSATGKVRSGWYYDLPDQGERVVFDSTYIPLTTKVQFSSLLPNAVGTSGICGVGGGEGKLYSVDLLAGVGQRRIVTVGIPGQPIILFDDEATTTGKADSTGRSLRSRGVVTLLPGSKSMETASKSREILAVGRLSWRQINNYLELKQ